VSSYGTDLQYQILQAGQQDDRDRELMLKLQQDTSDQDVDYHITSYGLVRFSDRIYMSDESELKKLILKEFHVNPSSGHLGYQKMLTVVNKFYYWLNTKKKVVEFVMICLEYYWVKAEFKHRGGLVQPIMIPKWKWEVTSMDFIIGLPRTLRQHDSIMVVVNRLSKVAHFNPVKPTYSASEVEQVFIMEIMRLHGFPKNIVLDRDSKFTSKFWKELFVGLGIELDFSTTYHPQTNGQTERVNRILEEMFRMYVIHQKRRWKQYLPLVEFAYNNNYQESLRMSLFDALYGWSCNTPIS